MNFSNPTALYFLPLALIPLLIHLLGKRTRRRVKFPWIELLKKASTEGRRRRTPFEIILLILRTLLLLLLILAFANPVHIGNLRGIKTLWVDISHSMSPYIQDEGKFIRNIKEMIPDVDVKFFADRQIDVNSPEKTYFSSSLKPLSGNSVIFTDLQRNMLEGAHIKGHTVIFVPQRRVANRGIVEFETDVPFATTDMPVPLSIKVENYSAEPWSGKVELKNSGAIVRGWETYLKPWESVTYRDTITINGGELEASLLPGDELDGDDRRFAFVPLLSSVKVVMNRQNRYLSAALRPVGIESPFELSVVTGKMDYPTAAGADVVFLTSPFSISELNLAKVAASSGKGVVLFVGDSSSAELVKKQLGLNIHKIGVSSIGDYVFYNLWSIVDGVPLLKDERGNPIAAYANNIIVCGFSPDPSSTDFIYSPDFPPFVNRIALTSLHKTTVYYVHPDTVLTVPTYTTSLFNLKLPNGKELPVTPFMGKGGYFVRIGPFKTVGIYNLVNQKDEVLAVIVVNIDPKESDVRPANAQDLKATFESYEVIKSLEGKGVSMKGKLLWAALLIFLLEVLTILIMRIKNV